LAAYREAPRFISEVGNLAAQQNSRRNWTFVQAALQHEHTAFDLGPRLRHAPPGCMNQGAAWP